MNVTVCYWAYFKSIKMLTDGKIQGLKIFTFSEPQNENVKNLIPYLRNDLTLLKWSDS